MSDTLKTILIALPVAGMPLLFLLMLGMSRPLLRSGAAKRPPTPFPGVPEDVHTNVLTLVYRKRHIEAVKTLRQGTGLGLADAKGYCDALRDGRPPPYLILPADPREGAAPPPLTARVRELLHAGDRDSAIALVRARTGMNPDEAVRFVEALD